jgi:hypothetical protein
MIIHNRRASYGKFRAQWKPVQLLTSWVSAIFLGCLEPLQIVQGFKFGIVCISAARKG